MKKCCCLSLSPALPWEGRGTERNFLEIYVVICVPEKGEVPYVRVLLLLLLPLLNEGRLQ